MQVWVVEAREGSGGGKRVGVKWENPRGGGLVEESAGEGGFGRKWGYVRGGAATRAARVVEEGRRWKWGYVGGGADGRKCR